MKGKDIIKLVQERGLEDFEIQVSALTSGKIFPNVESFKIDDLADIENSDKTATLDIPKIK